MVAKRSAAARTDVTAYLELMNEMRRAEASSSTTSRCKPEPEFAHDAFSSPHSFPKHCKRGGRPGAFPRFISQTVGSPDI